MMTDEQIAQQSTLQPIAQIAQKLNLPHDAFEPYGKYKAKIDIGKLPTHKQGKLILVTAINPTPAGEGKTTTSIGLADAFNYIGQKAVLALREPSLGPVFGIKGGATGGGWAQVGPMDEINLHFTGDFHAIGAANNLLAAMIDNHIYHGNALNIDPKRIVWRRALDMNDRQLRQIVDGLGKPTDGVMRQDGFDITVASEVMAVFCLAQSLDDLKQRLGNMLVAYTQEGSPVFARDLKAQGAMCALLKEAFKPNLVQTLEGTPAIIHGGPFANIAHGCNSIAATQTALALGDWVITEAGFGADLGAEKFCDIKCRQSGLKPDVAVLVATVRALKYNGGIAKTDLTSPNVDALQKGLPNLLKHIENLKNIYHLPTVVAINRFESDSEEELSAVIDACERAGACAQLCEVWEKGGKGGEALARAVLQAANNNTPFTLAYDEHLSLDDKINAIAHKIYGADGVDWSTEALADKAALEKIGFAHLPVCMAKTQYSLSDNPKLLSCPKNFRITIRNLVPATGAGFIVVICGNIMRMPGLPKVPAAENIDVDKDGHIVGLF